MQGFKEWVLENSFFDEKSLDNFKFKNNYDLIEKYTKEQLRIGNVSKSLPNDEEGKAHIDTLRYYGTCTTEYNEGFEDGVKWLKEQMAK